MKSSSVLQSIDPTTHRNNADRYYRNNEVNGYVQDKWQALTNLSITAGVRYDYHGGLTEKYGDMFNFDPSAYDVTGTTDSGFTVNNAGFVIAGNNKQNPTKGVSASTLNGRQWGVSPRIGFAWSSEVFPQQRRGERRVRGSITIAAELFTYLSQPAGGTVGGPFGVSESSPLVSVATGNSSTAKGSKDWLDPGKPHGRSGLLDPGARRVLCASEFKSGCHHASIAGTVEPDDGISRSR